MIIPRAMRLDRGFCATLFRCFVMKYFTATPMIVAIITAAMMITPPMFACKNEEIESMTTFGLFPFRIGITDICRSSRNLLPLIISNFSTDGLLGLFDLSKWARVREHLSRKKGGFCEGWALKVKVRWSIQLFILVNARITPKLVP